MSEDDEKKQPKSRVFRKLFLEFLDGLREDVEDGFEFERSFSGDSHLDDESTPDIREYFERAGLDINAPGHWQSMFVALVNFVHLEQPGTKPFTTEENNAFVRDIAALKIQHDVSRTKLCEMWVEKEREAGRHPSSKETAVARLQDMLGTLRQLKQEGKATSDEIEWLAIIDTPIQRDRRQHEQAPGKTSKT